MGGRWVKEEHDKFLQGLKLYGKDWKNIQTLVETRTAAQVRSHAQKYFAKIQTSNIEESPSKSYIDTQTSSSANTPCKIKDKEEVHNVFNIIHKEKKRKFNNDKEDSTEVLSESHFVRIKIKKFNNNQANDNAKDQKESDVDRYDPDLEQSCIDRKSVV